MAGKDTSLPTLTSYPPHLHSLTSYPPHLHSLTSYPPHSPDSFQGCTPTILRAVIVNGVEQGSYWQTKEQLLATGDQPLIQATI